MRLLPKLDESERIWPKMATAWPTRSSFGQTLPELVELGPSLGSTGNFRAGVERVWGNSGSPGATSKTLGEATLRQFSGSHHRPLQGHLHHKRGSSADRAVGRMGGRRSDGRKGEQVGRYTLLGAAPPSGPQPNSVERPPSLIGGHPALALAGPGAEHHMGSAVGQSDGQKGPRPDVR